MDSSIQTLTNEVTQINNSPSIKFLKNILLPLKEYGKAIHDYSGRAEDELTFEEEDVINISLKDENGDWYFGEINSTRGWFPSSCVRIISENEAISEGLVWPPPNIINSSSSYTFFKSSPSKDDSIFSIQNSSDSRDSLSTMNSSCDDSLSSGTNNRPGQTRSWFSKYQKIKKYQSRQFVKTNNGTIMSTSPMCSSFTKINSTERLSILEKEIKNGINSDRSSISQNLIQQQKNEPSQLSNDKISSEKLPKNLMNDIQKRFTKQKSVKISDTINIIPELNKENNKNNDKNENKIGNDIEENKKEENNNLNEKEINKDKSTDSFKKEIETQNEKEIMVDSNNEKCTDRNNMKSIENVVEGKNENKDMKNIIVDNVKKGEEEDIKKVNIDNDNNNDNEKNKNINNVVKDNEKEKDIDISSNKDKNDDISDDKQNNKMNEEKDDIFDRKKFLNEIAIILNSSQNIEENKDTKKKVDNSNEINSNINNIKDDNSVNSAEDKNKNVINKIKDDNLVNSEDDKKDENNLKNNKSNDDKLSLKKKDSIRCKSEEQLKKPLSISTSDDKLRNFSSTQLKSSTTPLSSSNITPKSSIGTLSNMSAKTIHRVMTPIITRQKWIDCITSEKLKSLNLTKKDIHRQEVIYEMIETEKDYIKDLDIIKDVILKTNLNLINIFFLIILKGFYH